MSDVLANPDTLDPDRPWITDEAQLPSRMSWIGSLFNPAGKSPKLHFTRVWTICFFLQFLIVVVPFGLGIVVSLAGGNPAPVKLFGLYASPVVFIATTVISFIAHSRRLNDAGKLSIWAFLILIPLLIGMALFSSGVMKKSAEYDGLYQERAEFLADPQTWRAERLEKQKKAQARANTFRALNTEIAGLFTNIYLGKDADMLVDSKSWRAENMSEFKRLQDQATAVTKKPEGQAGGDGQVQMRRGSGGRNNGPRADQPLPSQIDFILKPNVGIIQMVLFIMNLLIVLWSLFWVARVPDFGKAKPDEHDIFEDTARNEGAYS